MHRNISFSTWNIHGLLHSVLGDKTKNVDFLNNIAKLDFIFLTETWSNTDIGVPGFRAFVSDSSMPQTDKACRISGGIALLYRAEYEKYVSVAKKSKNFLWCKISKEMLCTNIDLFVCGIYIPPEKSSYFDNEIFDELENDLVSFSSKGNTMILGDFNARTSKLEDFVSKDGNNFIIDASENCLHPKNRENFDNNINNHGKHLINICKNTDMRIINGRTKGDSFGRPTFHGRNGTSVVDYIISSQDTFQHVNNFIVKPPTYLSDHSQIIAWFDIQTITRNEQDHDHFKPPLHKLPLQFELSENSKSNFRKTLKSPEIQNRMNELINTNFANDINGVSKCIDEFQNILTDVSKKSLKIRKKKNRRKITNVANKKWFDKECRFKRHELRKLANQKHKDPANINLRNDYQSALKIYKETLQTKKNEFHKNKINELIQATNQDSKLFWKTLENANDNLENTTNLSYSPTEGQWLRHFEKLHCRHELSRNHEILIEKLKEKENDKDQYDQLDNEITDHEIMNTVRNIKTKKAAYSDRISNEIIKSSADILIKGFNKIFNVILRSGQFPPQWCEGLITPIFKSGNKMDPNNYRGICVSSSLGKLFCSILNGRLITHIKEKEIIHPSQIGFMPGNRTADHILTLKTLHDKYIKQNSNKKIYACFVDFKKAFDSVWHDGLFLKLLENRLGGRFYDLIKNLYSNSKCAVKISDHRTPFFPYNRGVRQGCVLSPLLFNIYINELPKLFENTNSDPFILPNGTSINSLLYADDLIILSKSKSGLQNCLNILDNWSKKWMMEINFKKTKIMIFQKHNSKKLHLNTKFFLGNNPVAITNEYTYLGLKITPNAKFSIANQNLSEKAMHALFKIRKNLDFHYLPPRLACKIFDSIISPILLYNSEVWGAYMDNDYTKWDKTSTEKAHLKFCKLYLGVNRKASNLASRGELGRYPLQISVLKKVLTYVKNIYQLPDSCIAKQAFYSSKELYLSDRESFYYNVIKILKQYWPALGKTTDLETFIKETDINNFIISVKSNYVSFWRHQITNSRKLSFYCTFKKDYKLEEYLNVIKAPSKRRIFSKFRISNHKLLIEYGRYQNIPREERYCKLCDSGKIEDEFHFAFECHNYQNIRNDANGILKSYFQMTLTPESKQNLLSHAMSSTDSVLVDLFANFIVKCFNIRDKALKHDT